MENQSHEHQLTAFLCGQFTTNTEREFKQSVLSLLKAGWMQEPKGIREKHVEEYVPDFIDYCFAEDESNGCVAFDRPVNKAFNVTTDGMVHHAQLKELKLYIFPHRIALFSIEVNYSSRHLNDLTSLMRYLRRMQPNGNEEFNQLAIAPLMEAYRYFDGKNLSDDPDKLIEHGNKMRMFQIITSSEELELNEHQRDLVLYQLGSLAPEVNPADNDQDNVSRSYLKRMVANNRVSVFKRWNALALNDTFTLHANGEIPDKLMTEWRGYFRVLYIHSLFQKYYLSGLNEKYHETIAASEENTWKMIRRVMRRRVTPIEALTQEFHTYKSNGCFNRVSYNFLPLEIDRAIDRGLEVNDEQEQLKEMLQSSHNFIQERNNSHTKTLLVAISMLTVCSAICDLCDLVFNARHGDFNVFYTKAALLSALFVLIIAFFFIIRKRR